MLLMFLCNSIWFKIPGASVVAIGSVVLSTTVVIAVVVVVASVVVVVVTGVFGSLQT